MPNEPILNPAATAAQEALDKLFKVLDEHKSFIFEAGAGAGKTYSLVKALHHLIKKNGKTFMKNHQRIACISYTNVAKEQIDLRTDKNPVVHSDTIHAFCWSLIKNFQSELRKILPTLGNWANRIAEYSESLTEAVDDSEFQETDENEKTEIDYQSILGKKEVIYQLGYPSIDEDSIILGHDDVPNLMIELLNREKFRTIVTSKYPVILIDEYQDTYAPFADSLQTHFINNDVGPLIGFFGDHWQMIYGDGGKIENPKLTFIPKNANFRSVSTIVDVLNKMRPELTQNVEDPTSVGVAKVFHTNEWVGTRRTGVGGGHWTGDLPAQAAHDYLTHLRRQLEISGWDFDPEKTKILMLTHNVLAEEQGYRQLADVFRGNEPYIKKEDKYIAYFMDVLEPICEAYAEKKYGVMFSIIGKGQKGINSHNDKKQWSELMSELSDLRLNGTIGDVLDFIQQKQKPKLPESIVESEKLFRTYAPVEGEEEPSKIRKVRALRSVPYAEVIAVTKFVNNYTPFATNHSIKGEEYENVLVVVGRGWNKYNFDQMLGWFESGVPAGKEEAFERSRNLFYVACSRAKKNLIILFTQKLSDESFKTLTSWFGSDNIISLGPVAPILN